MTTHVWVVGGSGLLGSAVSRSVRSRAGWRLLDAPALPWAEPERVPDAATATMRSLLAASRKGDDWAIVWAAGASITSSPAEQFARELDEFSRVLDAIGTAIAGHQLGTFFFASSAGSIYAGSEHPPFTEETPARSISPYGDFKLAAEQRLERFAAETGVAVLLGRIANLYGPGQRLGKMQGLVSHIAMAQVSPRPVSIYVSLDTLRDYIYVDDCAALVLDGLTRLARAAEAEPGIVVMKILATGSPTSIAMLLSYFRALTKQAPHVMLGTSEAAALQARDLRLRSVVWTEIDRRVLTPMPTGIDATMRDIVATMQSGVGNRPLANAPGR